MRTLCFTAATRRFPRRRTSAIACLVATLLLATPAARAGGGDDHEHGHSHGEETAVAAAARPRVAVQSDAHDLVAILTGADTLTVYLDRLADNTPVMDAVVEVTVGDEALRAEARPDGTYVVKAATLAGRRESLELVFAVTGPGGDDLLIGELPAPAGEAGASHPAEGGLGARLMDAALGHPYAAGGALFVLGLLLGALLRGPRRVARRLPRETLAFAVSVGLATVSTPALAGGGHDHGAGGHDHGGPAAVAPAATVDTPRRLPDGTVFLPKPSQRLLEVRTAVVQPETAQRAVALIGRVIADPNRGGLAQSAVGGRVIPPEGGLPRLGQAVRRGEVLALVEPPLPAADRTTIAERSGEIEQLIAAAEARLQRARSLASTGAGTRIQVVDTEIELEGLRRRRAMVRENRIAPEVLRAPVDGVVASARVVAGQVVQAQDVLFQVIDPQGLWVEALAHDSHTEAAQIRSASAAVGRGQPMPLELRGFGRALQQQATLAHFAILNPPQGLSVGQPVTVSAQVGEPVTGIVVAREAVVRGGNGEALVWRHTAPETFEPTPIRTEALDAGRLLVLAGLEPGARVVVRGAELVNQIR